MNGENVHDALREMASDKGTPNKEVILMIAAVLADVSEVVGKINVRQKAQDITNVKVNNKIRRNTNLLDWYNRGVWALSAMAVLWGLERFLTSL